MPARRNPRGPRPNPTVTFQPDPDVLKHLKHEAAQRVKNGEEKRGVLTRVLNDLLHRGLVPTIASRFGPPSPGARNGSG